jgi:U6 snRNA-associated Sm-like protein LSm2
LRRFRTPLPLACSCGRARSPPFPRALFSSAAALCRRAPQIFQTFFRTLVGQTVTVELKNDLQIRGVLESVDQYLNLKLAACEVVEKERHPQLLALRTIFVRGSVVRYVHVPKEHVDVELLQDAARKEALEAAKGGAGGKR